MHKQKENVLYLGRCPCGAKIRTLACVVVRAMAWTSQRHRGNQPAIDSLIEIGPGIGGRPAGIAREATAVRIGLVGGIGCLRGRDQQAGHDQQRQYQHFAGT